MGPCWHRDSSEEASTWSCSKVDHATRWKVCLARRIGCKQLRLGTLCPRCSLPNPNQPSTVVKCLPIGASEAVAVAMSTPPSTFVAGEGMEGICVCPNESVRYRRRGTDVEVPPFSWVHQASNGCEHATSSRSLFVRPQFRQNFQFSILVDLKDASSTSLDDRTHSLPYPVMSWISKQPLHMLQEWSGSITWSTILTLHTRAGSAPLTVRS